MRFIHALAYTAENKKTKQIWLVHGVIDFPYPCEIEGNTRNKNDVLVK